MTTTQRFDENPVIEAMQRQAMRYLQEIREPTGGCRVSGSMDEIEKHEPSRYAQAVEIIAWAGERNKPPPYVPPIERLRKWAAEWNGTVDVEPMNLRVIMILRKRPDDIISAIIRAAHLVRTNNGALLGLAMNPADERAIRDAQPHPAMIGNCTLRSPAGTIAGIPYIVDPRVKRGAIEQYADERLWHERVREQNEWDAELPVYLHGRCP